MLQALSVYGRDDCAQFTGPSVAMGRCLLRTLPEDSFDRQPLSAGAVTSLVADVRLDNRVELGAELGLSHEDTIVMADSDMLLAAWQRWREQCVDHLSGAFSFAPEVSMSPSNRTILAASSRNHSPALEAVNAA